MKQYEQVTKYKKVFKEAKDLPIEEINKQLGITKNEIKESLDFHLEVLTDLLSKASYLKKNKSFSSYIKMLQSMISDLEKIQDLK